MAAVNDRFSSGQTVTDYSPSGDTGLASNVADLESEQGQRNPLYEGTVKGAGSDTGEVPTLIRHIDVVEDDPENTSGTIKAFTYEVEDQLLRGTMAFSKNKLQELDPSYQGYTHIFCVRVPPVLTAVANGQQVVGFDGEGTRGVEIGRQHCINLKTLFEMGCTSYSGTPSLTLNTAQVNVGWGDRQYAAPTTAEFDSTQFTLNVLEVRGDLLRHGIEYWISAVSDPNVKAAMMNGALDAKGHLLAPTLANYTWTFMILQTDQTMLTIQDISLWNSCVITGIDRSNLDWENGTVDIVQPRSISFQGVYMPSCRNKYLMHMAERLLYKRLKYYKRYQDMGELEIGTKEWDAIGETWRPSESTDGATATA